MILNHHICWEGIGNVCIWKGFDKAFDKIERGKTGIRERIKEMIVSCGETWVRAEAVSLEGKVG